MSNSLTRDRTNDGVHAYPLFSYTTNGNDHIHTAPDPPSVAEAKPFHVAARTDAWIPISVLVYARDAKHAKQRILLGEYPLRPSNELSTEST